MGRPLFLAFLVFAASMQYLSADEPAVSSSFQRKLAIENTLDLPLNWKPSDEEHATLAELIEHIREEHRLQVRWDVGSLGLVFGEQALLGELLPTPLAGRSSSPSLYPTSGVVTYGSTCQPGYGPDQGQPQLVNSYAAPTAFVVAETPSVPGHGYGVASTEASGAPVPNQQPTVALPVTPGADQPAPEKRMTQQPAAPVVAIPVTDSTATTAPSSLEHSVPDEPAVSGPASIVAEYQTSPISLSAVSLENATVREGLQQLLDAVSVETAAVPLSVGVPFATRALALTLLVDENSVLVTTQLRANAKKETRIYRIDSLGDIPPEALERVITHSVRPWSWRNQANEIAEQLVARWPKTALPLPEVEFDTTEGLRFKTAEADSDAATSANTTPKVSAEAVEATGQLLAGGAVATVHSIVAALEMIHHGDPPTGVIESLPGMLIITQSQSAHREIRELLHELGAGD